MSTPALSSLTTPDRCDSCGAPGLVLVTIAMSELCFCGHHFNCLRDELAEAGAVVVADYRQPSQSPPPHKRRSLNDYEAHR